MVVNLAVMLLMGVVLKFMQQQDRFDMAYLLDADLHFEIEEGMYL